MSRHVVRSRVTAWGLAVLALPYSALSLALNTATIVPTVSSPRLPGLPGRGSVLLAAVHHLRLRRQHLGQGPALRARCRGLQLFRHR